MRVSKYTDPDRPTSTEKYDPAGKRKKKRPASYSSRYPGRAKEKPSPQTMHHDPNWRKKSYSSRYPDRKKKKKTD